MQVKIKYIILFILCAILWLSAIMIFGSIREKYLYKFIANKLEHYVETKWGSHLYIGKIKGNLFTNLELENLLLTDLKDFSKELQLKAESVKVSYRPFGILLGEFDAGFEAPQLTYKNISLPLDIHHHSRLTTITFKKRFPKLDSLKEILPKDIYLAGVADVDGEAVLKDFSFQFFNLGIKSRDCQIGYATSLKARGNIDLDMSGKIDCPQISGDINISYLYLPSGLSSLSLFKIQSANLESKLPKKSTININIYGKRVIAKDRDLNLVLNASLKFTKENSEEKPYVLGKIDILQGIYRDYSDTFNIKKGQIVFTENKSPQIELEAETKIRRYRIYARIKGTLDNSYLIFSSKPELAQSEIASLLVFGKNVDALTNVEKRGLTRSDFNNVLINNLFLGKAEAKLTESLGLDDINLNFNTQQSINDGVKSPSIEVGKYIVDDKLYGAYNVKRDTTKNNLPEQAVKGELALNDNMVLKGERHWQQSLSTPKEDKLSVEFRWKF